MPRAHFSYWPKWKYLIVYDECSVSMSLVHVAEAKTRQVDEEDVYSRFVGFT